MLRPSKSLNLEYSVINVASSILRLIIKHRLLKYEELLLKISTEIGEGAKENFLNALTFLYAIDALEYHEETDCFEIRIK